MSFRLRLPSKSATFAALMAVAAVLCLLPASWTGWMRGPGQVLGLPQRELSSMARAGRDGLTQAAQTEVTQKGFRQLQAENEELRHLVRHQEAWLRDLEGRYKEVCGVRGQLGDVGAEILIAPVWGYDASQRRDTLIIGRGSLAAVRVGQWVAAGAALSEHDPREAGWGRRLLMRQWLIGRVSEVRPQSSRVRLVSDPKSREPVCLARVLADGRCAPPAGNAVLLGQGRGRMMIGQADADYAALGCDLVLSRPSADLPIMLTIGRVVNSTPMEESALHFDLVVESWGDPRDQRYVYVIQVGR